MPAMSVLQSLAVEPWSLPLVPCAVLVGRGAQLAAPVPEPEDRAIRREKQLLVEMADAGGRISPVRAALGTS
jgi:hypothetical protein